MCNSIPFQRLVDSQSSFNGSILKPFWTTRKENKFHSCSKSINDFISTEFIAHWHCYYLSRNNKCQHIFFFESHAAGVESTLSISRHCMPTMIKQLDRKPDFQIAWHTVLIFPEQFWRLMNRKPPTSIHNTCIHSINAQTHTHPRIRSHFNVIIFIGVCLHRNRRKYIDCAAHSSSLSLPGIGSRQSSERMIGMKQMYSTSGAMIIGMTHMPSAFLLLYRAFACCFSCCCCHFSHNILYFELDSLLSLSLPPSLYWAKRLRV